MNKTNSNNKQSLTGLVPASGTKTILASALAIGGFFYAKNWWESYQQSKENKKAAEDNTVNIASQIHSENRATYTEDNIQIGLFRQITDFQKTSDEYKLVSKGKDILEDTRAHVSSGAYQQILNIVGVKGGAVKPTSQTSKDVQSNIMKFSWVVAKVDARIRKSPKAGSAVFTIRPNIVGTAHANTIVGIIDKQSFVKNGGKLFFDDENNVFFLPILVFDSNDIRHYYSAYVAVSNVNVFKEQPKQLPLFRLSSWAYTQAFATSGIENNNSIDGLTDISKLML